MIRAAHVAILAALLLCPALASGGAPFAITIHGHFKRLLHTGDASGKVALDSIPTTAGLYGLGALADLRGEILLWDGRVLVTHGERVNGTTRQAMPGEQAALLGTALVDQWHEEIVPRDMEQQEFEGHVLDSARAMGIDVNEPFPFLVRGTMTNLTWHVITGKAAGHAPAGGHRLGHAQNRVFTGAEARGRLVGLYSAARLEGIITHPGERFHVHYADDDLTLSGHVDAYAPKNNRAEGTLI